MRRPAWAPVWGIGAKHSKSIPNCGVADQPAVHSPPLPSGAARGACAKEASKALLPPLKGIDQGLRAHAWGGGVVRYRVLCNCGQQRACLATDFKLLPHAMIKSPFPSTLCVTGPVPMVVFHGPYQTGPAAGRAPEASITASRLAQVRNTVTVTHWKISCR